MGQHHHAEMWTFSCEETIFYKLFPGMNTRVMQLKEKFQAKGESQFHWTVSEPDCQKLDIATLSGYRPVNPFHEGSVITQR